MKKEVLRMERVTYIAEGCKLLNNFNFQLFEGEVMGLVPLDPYGLDEFIECVQSNRQLLYGRVYIREKLVNTYEVKPRTKNNVYSIFKDENLVQGLTPADNIFLIRKGNGHFLVRNSLIQKQLKRLLDEVGIEIDIKSKVKDLSVFEKYVIEILKAVVAKADIVILKDIAASVHPEDVGKLKHLMQYYARQKVSFIYISAKTDGLVQLCDRVSLMSHGRIIKVLEHDEIEDSLENHYFFPYQYFEKRQPNSMTEGECVFKCEDLCMRTIQNMTFDVKKGECLLIYDYHHFDWNDFISVLSGEKPQKGHVWWEGKEDRDGKRKIAIVLENPTETMLFPEMSYEDNLCMYMDHRIDRLWWDRKKRMSIAKEIIGREVPSKVKELTVKEKYELIYHKILLQNPELVFCFFPYMNMDMKTRQLTNKFIKRYLSKGIAVVIITMDIAGGANLADRILLFGKKKKEFEKEEFDRITGDETKATI